MILEFGKKKRGRTIAIKSKETLKIKIKKMDEVDLGDLEGKEDAPIKWREY